jgi:F-type H+-transporting ATPase subunit b
MLAELTSNPEFWVLVAFVVVIIGLGYKGWPLATSMLDARAAKIKAELDEAQKLRDEAQRALGDFQRKQRDALQEAEAIIAHARGEASRFAERAALDLEAAIERRQRLAAERIALAEAKAIAEVRNLAADIAIGAARAVIAERLGDAQGQALIDQAIAELPQRLN